MNIQKVLEIKGQFKRLVDGSNQEGKPISEPAQLPVVDLP